MQYSLNAIRSAQLVTDFENNLSGTPDARAKESKILVDLIQQLIMRQQPVAQNRYEMGKE